MSLAMILHAQNTLKEKLSKLPAGFELRLADFTLILARENVALSQSSLAEVVRGFLDDGTLVRVTRQRMAVAARETIGDDPPVTEEHLHFSDRVANLEKQVADLTSKLNSLSNRLI